MKTKVIIFKMTAQKQNIQPQDGYRGKSEDHNVSRRVSQVLRAHSTGTVVDAQNAGKSIWSGKIYFKLWLCTWSVWAVTAGLIKTGTHEFHLTLNTKTHLKCFLALTDMALAESHSNPANIWDLWTEAVGRHIKHVLLMNEWLINYEFK